MAETHKTNDRYRRYSMFIFRPLILRSFLLLVLLAFPVSEVWSQSEELSAAYNTYSELTNNGRFEEAIPYGRKMVELAELEFGQHHEAVAFTLGALAALYWKLELYDQAEPLFLRALSIYKNTQGANDPRLITVYFQLAIIYDKQGRYREAESNYEQFFELMMSSEAVDENDMQMLMTALFNLGTIYRLNERYSEAEELFKWSLELYEEQYGPDNIAVALALSSLANVYRAQGRFENVEKLLLKALTILGTDLGREHESFATTLNSLASFYRDFGQYAEAEELYFQALSTYLSILGPDHLSTGVAANNLGLLYKVWGKPEDAEYFFKMALVIFEKSGTSDRPDVASTFCNLASLFSERQQYEEAEQIFFRCVESYEASGSTERLATGLGLLGRMYFQQGRYLDALLAIQRGTAIVRKMFESLGKTDTFGFDRQILLNRQLFQLHIDIALHPDQQGSRGVLKSEAFEVLQLARASSTAGAIARMAARFSSGDDQMAVLIRERQDALAYYEKLDAELVNNLSKAPGEQDLGVTNRIRDTLKSLEARLHKFDQVIQRRYPEYAELTRREPLSIQTTQTLLDSNEAILTFIQSVEGHQTHVFVVRHNQSAAYTVELSINELGEMVTKLRAGVDPTAFQSLTDFPAFDTEIAFELYKRLLSPAKNILSGVTHLFVVPEGALQSLPLGVLVTEKPKKVPEHLSDYQNIVWLYKDYAITTLPSVASLRALRTFASKTKATKPFIGFGDPILGGDSGASKGLELGNFYRGAIGDVEEIRQLSGLPGTAQELRAMAKYLGANDAMVYLREKATETQVKTLPLDDHKVVAFSTHGLVSGEMKNLAEPALVLTPPQEGTATDDGLLTASEVAQLQLDANWVILSACNTAAGEKPGAEGLSGLAKAFFYAGARALLVSHWPVESNAATALTNQMFDAIKKNPTIGRAEALRQSMLQLASSKTKPFYAHPLFWAPFVVVGEGGDVTN